MNKGVECRACPNGQYQDATAHHFTQCKTRPPQFSLHKTCPAGSTENITEDECRYVVADQLKNQGVKNFWGSSFGFGHESIHGGKCYATHQTIYYGLGYGGKPNPPAGMNLGSHGMKNGRIWDLSDGSLRVCKRGGPPKPFCDTGSFCEDFENGEYMRGMGGAKNGPSPKERWTFTGGHQNYRVAAPTIISGAKCHGGKGSCLQFGGCTAYGDAFSKFDGASNCYNGGKPQISFWYSGGGIFAGTSRQIPGPHGHGHQHSWPIEGTANTSGAIGDEWKKITFAPGNDQYHLMFEAFQASHQPEGPTCNSLIDDIQVTCVPR